jgi:hypothetical protein
MLGVGSGCHDDDGSNAPSCSAKGPRARKYDTHAILHHHGPPRSFITVQLHFLGQKRSTSAVIVCCHHLQLSLLVMIHASASALHEKLGVTSREDGVTTYTCSSDFQTLLLGNRKKLCNQNAAMFRNSRCSPQ